MIQRTCTETEFSSELLFAVDQTVAVQIRDGISIAVYAYGFVCYFTQINQQPLHSKQSHRRLKWDFVCHGSSSNTNGYRDQQMDEFILDQINCTVLFN